MPQVVSSSRALDRRAQQGTTFEGACRRQGQAKVLKASFVPARLQ